MKKLLMSSLAVSSLAVAGVATVQADAKDNQTFGAKRTAVKSLPRRLLIINKK